LPIDLDTYGEQTALEKDSSSHSPLDVVSNAGQLAHKKHRAEGLPLDVDNDAQQPPPKKAKNEMNADGTVLSSGVKGERQLPQIKSEVESKHENQISASGTPAPKPNAPSSINHKASKQTPIIVEDESENDDLVIVSATSVSRVQPTSTPAPAQVSVTRTQNEDQAKRERKKAILKKRLEQLKIEQELLEMED
jgi:hypothetical protein